MRHSAKKIVRQGLFFTVASLSGNLLNLCFNFYLGRSLSPADYALIGLFLGMVYAANVFFNALSITTSHVIGTSRSNERSQVLSKILSTWDKNILFGGVIATLIWVAISIPLSLLFKVDYVTLLFFIPALIFGTLAFTNRGILLGLLRFGSAGTVFLTESSVKLFAALVLTYMGLMGYAYLAIPLSILAAYGVSVFLVRRATVNFAVPSITPINTGRLFPRRFFLFSFLLGLSTLTFLSLDVILAKTYFTAEIAGGYTLITLSGKIIFLFSSLLSGLVVSVVSNAIGENKSTKKIFHFFFSISILAVTVSSLVFIFFGEYFFRLLFGSKIDPVISILPEYVYSVALYSIASTIVFYHHARRKFVFPIVASLSGPFLLFGSVFFHASTDQFVGVFFVVSCLNILFIGLLHMYSGHFLPQGVKDNDVPATTAPLVSEVSIRTKLPTVTIGLPAYNEEYNIKNILGQILQQKQDGFVIEKIIVASDGSTDNTVEFATEFQEHGVTVIAGDKNFGKSYRQNEIVSITKSDVIVFLDADILLNELNAISRLVSPIINGADLSAAWAKPLPAKTFIEKVLCAGFELKHYVYSRYRGGQNIYTCVGAMRAFSKRFYSKIVFPSNSAGEDQYLYLACIKGGFHYKYAGSIDANFKYPDNFLDYKKYVRRIFQTQKKHGEVFGEDFVRAQRHLPPSLIAKGCIYGLMKNPFYASLYLVSHVVMQQWAIRQPRLSVEVSKSTKKLLN